MSTITKKRLLELLNKANTVKDMLEIENELARIHGEIESFQAANFRAPASCKSSHYFSLLTDMKDGKKYPHTYRFKV